MPARLMRPATFALATALLTLAACATPSSQPPARAPQAREAAQPADSAKVFDNAATEVKPRLINGTAVAVALEQNYPPGLRDAGIGGTVVLRFIVERDGRTSGIVVTKTDDPGFSAPAHIVVRTMRFRPAMLDGKPVRVLVSLPVTFVPPR